MTQQIAIVGAGICGLCTALALASRGHQITVHERDQPPPSGGAHEAFFEWPRRGAAQFRHPHAFLGLMCNILQDNYPDLIEAFFKAGARKVTFKEMLPDEMQVDYIPEPGDEKLWILMCRRATIETVMRRYVEQQDNITIRSGSNIDGLLSRVENDQLLVEGLVINNRGETEEVRADLVVDASGRTTRFPGWLKEQGSLIGIEDDDAEIVYYTRHYKLAEGIDEPARDSKERSAGDLGYLKFGVFPGDGGHFAIILCLPNDELELRQAVKDPETFDAICREIPGLRRWLGDLEEPLAEATTASFGFGDIHAIWTHFVTDGKPAALNFFAVGDAAVRTNPLYGRGCSIGIMHAHLLAEVLDGTDDPSERAFIYDKRTEEEIRPIFKASLSEDKNGIKRAAAVREGDMLDEADSVKKWLRLAFGDAISAASREQLAVIRGAMKTFHLLEKPGDFLKDWKTRFILMRYLIKGRKANAASRLLPGPDRSEMLKVVEHKVSDAA